MTMRMKMKYHQCLQINHSNLTFQVLKVKNKVKGFNGHDDINKLYMVVKSVANAIINQLKH